jgi:hypothetical protein
VTHADHPGKHNPPEWMVVYTANNVNEGHIIAGRLVSEGIQAVVAYTPGASAMGLTVGLWGEVTVLVHPSDYETACDILEYDEPDFLAADNDQVIFDDFEDEDGEPEA